VPTSELPGGAFAPSSVTPLGLRLTPILM